MEVVVAWLETLVQDCYTEIKQDCVQSQQPVCVKIRTRRLSNKKCTYYFYLMTETPDHVHVLVYIY